MKQQKISHLLKIQMIQFGLTEIKRMMIPGTHTTALNIKNKYGLPSHDLRRFGITALINEGVSPFRIWDVVRHKILGMSKVTMMYNRPTTEDLIEAMEIISK